MLKKYICKRKCVWKNELFMEGTYHMFDPDSMPPNHFTLLEQGSPAVKEAIDELTEKIVGFEKTKNPHPAEVIEARRNKQRVKELEQLK